MSNKIYESKKDQYENESSSANALLFIGGLGIVFMILNLTHIIRIPFQGAQGILMQVVMTLLFLFFIGFGLYSRKRAKLLKVEIKKESSDSETLQEWILANLTSEKVDASCDLSGVTNDTEKYMIRMNGMKKIVSQSFPQMNDSFIEHILEENYDTIYKD